MCALQSKRIVAILLHFSKFLGCSRKAAWHNCTSCSLNLLKTQTGSGAAEKMVWVENEELVDNKSHLPPHATTYIWAQRLVSPICNFLYFPFPACTKVMKLNILERCNIDIWDMVRKFDAVTFRWAWLAWLVVSEGYVYHSVKKLALFNEITINILITIIINQHDVM